MTYLGSILMLLAEFSFVFNMTLGALANPNLVTTGRAYALELPTVTTTPLVDDWMAQYIESGGTWNTFSDTTAAPGVFKFRY